MTTEDVVAAVVQLEFTLRVLVGFLIFAHGWYQFRFWSRGFWRAASGGSGA